MVRKLKARDLELRCLELRRSGMGSSEIAKQLGIRPSRASSCFKRAMARQESLLDYEVEEYKKLQLQSLGEMKAALYGQAIGDEIRMITIGGREFPVKMVSPEAIKTVLGIMDMEAKLLGTYAPKRIDAKVETVHAIDEQLEALIAKARGSGLPQPGPRSEIPLALEAPGKAEPIDTTGELVSVDVVGGSRIREDSVRR